MNSTLTLVQVQALLSDAMTDAAAISRAAARWLPACFPTISNAVLFMHAETAPSVSKAASHHRLSLNPKPNAPESDAFFYCSATSTKLMPFVQDNSVISIALAQGRPLVGVCPMKSMLFVQLLKDARVAAALSPTPAAPSTPLVATPSSALPQIFHAADDTLDSSVVPNHTPAADDIPAADDTPATEVAAGIFKAMSRIQSPDHSFIILLPINNAAVLAIELCDGCCPDADFLEALRGICTCIDRCIDMAGVFEKCIGNSQRVSQVSSTSISQAHASLIKASKKLLQCSIVQVYEVEWSRVSSGPHTNDHIPYIRCIIPDGTQVGLRGDPLPPGTGCVWRAVTRSELVLVRRCADDAVFRQGIDCPYDCIAESAIVCPCVVDGQVIGAVSFVNKRSGLFLLGDTLAAELLSRGMGISIAAAKTIASERARAEEALHGMTKHCASLVRAAG
jgi:hypothetical protein